MLLIFFYRTLTFTCFQENMTVAYNSANGLLYLDAWYAEELDTKLQQTCKSLNDETYNVIVTIGQAEFQLNGQVFREGNSISLKLVCKEVSTCTATPNTCVCNTKYVKTLNIARYQLSFPDLLIDMTSVVQNFRVRWFDHRSCWKNTDAWFDFQTADKGGMRITQQTLGCDYTIDSLNNTDYFVGVDNPRNQVMPKQKKPHPPDANANVIRDLTQGNEGNDFFCAAENQTCRELVGSTVKVDFVDATFRLEVPIRITKTIENEPDLVITDTVSFTQAFRFVLSNNTNDCYDPATFKISYHTAFVKFSAKKGAQTNCQLRDYQDGDVALISILTQDEELTVSSVYNYHTTVKELRNDIELFIGCDQMDDPADCDLQLPKVDTYKGVLNQLQFKIYKNDVQIDRISYEVPTQTQCYNFGNAMINDTSICFTLGVLQSCNTKQFVFKTVDIVIQSANNRKNFAFQNYLGTIDWNCYVFQKGEAELISEMVQEQGFSTSVVVDGVDYPLQNFANEMNLSDFTALWYVFAVIAVIAIVSTSVIGYKCLAIP